MYGAALQRFPVHAQVLPQISTHLACLVCLHLELWYRSLPQELQGLTALVTLDLSHNALTELPVHIINTWATSGSLQQLNLSDNQLVQLPEELCRVTSLQELLLHHNDLLLLPSQVSSRTSGGMGF